MVALGVLISISVFLPRSLGQAADLTAPTPTGIKPEWYFLFLFQTLKLFPARVFFLSGEAVAILVVFCALLLFFFLPLVDNRPAQRKGRIISFISLAAIIYAIVMTIWSLLE